MAGIVSSVAASITAQNTFSDGIDLARGTALFRLRGTWAATVHLQLSDDGTNWDDVDSRAVNGAWVFDVPHAGLQYRFGVKTGNFTSGTVAGRISQ